MNGSLEKGSNVNLTVSKGPSVDKNIKEDVNQIGGKVQIGNRYYFSDSRGIYRIRMDGTGGRKKIANDLGQNFNVTGNQFYYTDENGDLKSVTINQ